MIPVRYVDAYQQEPTEVARFLWAMMEESLAEPHTTISHQAMPTWAEHIAWLAAKSNRVFLLIESKPPLGYIGYVSISNHNEIGIRIAKAMRGQGIGRHALGHLLGHYDPEPGVPSVRRGKFVANINPANAASIALFSRFGARHIQNTYEVPPRGE